MLKWIFLAVLASTPVSAATVKAVYTGTVIEGGDATGIFGERSALLNGLAYTATFLYDTELGQRISSPGLDTVQQNESELPVLSASMTIGGLTYSFAPQDRALVLASVGVGSDPRASILHQAVSDDLPGDSEDRIFLFAEFADDVLTRIDEPGTLTNTRAGILGSFLFSFQESFASSYQYFATGTLDVDSVEISIVPVPGSLGLLATGVGLFVLARRRKTHASAA